MNEKIESYYPAIGQAFLDALPSFSQAWMSFETIGDVWASEAFYREKDTSSHSFHYLNSNLEDVEHLLQAMRDEFLHVDSKTFTQVTVWLSESGEFSIEFGYDDVSDFDDAHHRRQVWIKKHLGDDADIHWGSD